MTASRQKASVTSINDTLAMERSGGWAEAPYLHPILYPDTEARPRGRSGQLRKINVIRDLWTTYYESNCRTTPRAGVPAFVRGRSSLYGAPRLLSQARYARAQSKDRRHQNHVVATARKVTRTVLRSLKMPQIWCPLWIGRGRA